MAEGAHSEYSASQFEADMLCPGRRVMQRGLTRGSNIYAFSGTCMHEVHEECLLSGAAAVDHIGRQWSGEGFTYVLDDEGADIVDCSLNHMRELTMGADSVEAEVRVHYGRFIGVDDAKAWGTADVLALRLAEREVFVGDLKTGRDPVDADSPQLKLYGAGALAAYEDFAEIDTIRLAITQPKDQRAPKEHVINVAELKAWLAGPATQAVRTIQTAEQTYREGDEEWQSAFLRPNEKSCKWCAAKATCPALRDEVADTVCFSTPASPDEFEAKCQPIALNEEQDAAWLAACLSKVDLIEDWCKAVRAEVERRLLAGESVPGYKLVAGKRGARAWTDEAEAEKLLKTMRLKSDVMYDFTVKSPTQIAKLGPALDNDGKPKPPKPGETPPVIGPRQWPKVAALIKQPPGKPHVAPLDDKRPALEIRPVSDDFDLA